MNSATESAIHMKTIFPPHLNASFSRHQILLNSGYMLSPLRMHKVTDTSKSTYKSQLQFEMVDYVNGPRMICSSDL